MENSIQNIAILGSTGSIGTQTLEVIKHLQQNTNIKIELLSAHTNIELLYEQICKFLPTIAILTDKTQGNKLREKINKSENKNIKNTKLAFGYDALLTHTATNNAKTIVNALVGSCGLMATVAAIKAKKNIALANKEVLVMAGSHIMYLAKKYNVNIFPLDSEHSAIFQCLKAGTASDISKLYLTASGGPFRDFSPQKLEKVTKAQALNHPNWSMGKKISIDSATMANKGLEIIEACHLFNVHPQDIHVIIHHESIIHSMVEFADGQIMAQLGPSDMRLPIQYALTYPLRLDNPFKRLSLSKISSLSFKAANYELYPCLKLAYDAIQNFPTNTALPIIFNAANEVAVEMFLNDRINFNSIAKIIKTCMENISEQPICQSFKKMDIENVNFLEAVQNINLETKKYAINYKE